VSPAEIRQRRALRARRAVEQHGHAEAVADARADAARERDRDARVRVAHSVTADVVHHPAPRMRRGVVAQIHQVQSALGEGRGRGAEGLRGVAFGAHAHAEGEPRTVVLDVAEHVHHARAVRRARALGGGLERVHHGRVFALGDVHHRHQPPTDSPARLAARRRGGGRAHCGETPKSARRQRAGRHAREGDRRAAGNEEAEHITPRFSLSSDGNVGERNVARAPRVAFARTPRSHRRSRAARGKGTRG
jgi:hypothetical protein